MMTKSVWTKWLCSITATVGFGSLAVAGAPKTMINTDNVFGNSENGIQQVSHECITADPCAPAACDDPALSCDSCDGCGGCFGGDGFDLGSKLFAEDSGWDIGGWTQWGYTNNSDGVFNTHPGRFNNHQSYVFVEKKADGSEGIGFGGRADLVYGVDAQNTQAFGNNFGRYDFSTSWNHGIYGWALPQLYGEMAYGDLSVKAGHFYTLHGYEVVTAPGNFFYSHAFTMNFSEPFTHTGVLGTYKVNDKLTVYGGWVAGWDTGFDRFEGGSAVQTGFTYAATDKLSLTYLTTIGNNGWIGDGYTHSIVGSYKITDKLTYVLLSDLVEANGSSVFGAMSNVSAANYLLYNITDKVGVGGRAEWYKTNGQSYYEVTAGLNFKPVTNLVIRPEIRHQWTADAPGGVLNGGLVGAGIVGDETIFGIDAILTF
jgi:hypothetical protein